VPVERPPYPLLTQADVSAVSPLHLDPRVEFRRYAPKLMAVRRGGAARSS
jgi:hypothetical protein